MTEQPHKKPRTSIPFLPDPSKWIQTGSGSGSAPSSSTRKVAQRPLVSLRNAFATPPTTTVKRRLEPGSEAAGATRRQGSLTGFLTPPPTSSISTSQGGRGSRAVSHAKVPRVESRPRAVPLQAHRSAPVTSSSSGSGSSSPSRVRHEQEQEQGKKRSRRTLTSSPEPDPEPELEPEASGYPSTPVPDDVLDIHRRLCGRDSERMKRVISPWRAFDASAPRAASPSKSGIGGSKSKPKLKTGAARGMGVGVNKENNRKPAQVDENEKNGPKLGKRTATKILSPPPHRSPTPQKRKPKSRHPSVLSPLGSKASIRGLSPSAIYRAFKVPSISPPSHNANVQRRRSTSPGSPTPKKSKISPVSRSPLFSPPPRPLPVKAPQDDFEPVTMEAETLMTWSLGPNRAPIRPAPAPLIRDDSWDTQSLAPSHASQSFPNLLSSPTRRSLSLSPRKPDLAPAHGHGHGQGSTSMLLPETIAQSPAQRISFRKSLARFPTDRGVPETILVPPVSSQSPIKHDVSPTRPLSPGRGIATSPRTSLSRLADTDTDIDRNHNRVQQRYLSPVKHDVRPVEVPTRLGDETPSSRPRPTLARTPTQGDVSRVSGRSRMNHDASPVASARVTPARHVQQAPVPSDNGEVALEGGAEAKSARTATRSRSPAAKKIRKSGSHWPEFAIGPSTSSPNNATPRAKRASPPPSSTATQSRLAAFGFFADRPRPAKPVRGFDEDWDDEEDLAFEFDEDEPSVEDQHGDGEREQVTMLGPVPEPPPHPSLRPAGLRELERRRRQAAAVNGPPSSSSSPAPYPPSSSSQPGGQATGEPSSLTTSSEEVGSAAVWWAGLGDRRSSEFGSLS